MVGPVIAQQSTVSEETVTYRSTDGVEDEASCIGPYLVLSIGADATRAGSLRIPIAEAERLHFGRGDRRGVERVLEKSGRRTCRISLPDPQMSITHATLTRGEDGRWFLQDARSKNGTAINGDRIEEPAELFDGDIISVGATFFLFRCAREVERLAATRVSAVAGFSSLHPGLQRMFDQMAIVAATDQPIVLFGSVGTGRRAQARRIHERSARRGALLESSLSESLVAADLQEGTRVVVLNEENDVKPIASLLLRDRDRSERLIVIASRDQAESLSDRARQLTPHRFELPNLALRAEDIGSLVGELLERYGAPDISLRRSTARALLLHVWPGNIGELEAAIKHAAPLATEGTLRLAHLPPAIAAAETLARERRRLVGLLTKHKGNVSAVARDLDLSRPSVYEIAERFGISVVAFRKADEPRAQGRVPRTPGSLARTPPLARQCESRHVTPRCGRSAITMCPACARVLCSECWVWHNCRDDDRRTPSAGESEE